MDIAQGFFSKATKFLLMCSKWNLSKGLLLIINCLVQVPQKLGARVAVQSTRASSIEVFVDDECAQYVFWHPLMLVTIHHMIFFSKFFFQLFQETSSASSEEPKSFCSEAQASNKQKP
jgi:hypothetical protein